MSRSLAVHDDLVAAAAERHGGRFLEAQGEGDSTVTMYPAPDAAVSAAIDIVSALATDRVAERPAARGPGRHPHRRDRPAPRRLRRPTLNLAARLRGLGEAGEIVVSQTTAALVRSPPARWREPRVARSTPLARRPRAGGGLRGRRTWRAHAAPADRVSLPRPPVVHRGRCRPLLRSRGDRGRDRRRDSGPTRSSPWWAPPAAASHPCCAPGLRPGLGISDVITPGRNPLAALETVHGAVVIDQFEELFTQGADDD